MAAPFTLIRDGESLPVEATVDAGRVFLSLEVVHEALGWELKPEGLCQGDVCVPVRDPAKLKGGAGLDLGVLAETLGRPLALDADEGVAALGIAASDQTARLESLEAPDFTLPDLDGKLHSLSDHRGKKVLLIAYASW